MCPLFIQKEIIVERIVSAFIQDKRMHSWSWFFNAVSIFFVRELASLRATHQDAIESTLHIIPWHSSKTKVKGLWLFSPHIEDLYCTYNL